MRSHTVCFEWMPITLSIDSMSEYAKWFKDGQVRLASEIINIIVNMKNVAPEYGLAIDQWELVHILEDHFKEIGIKASHTKKRINRKNGGV